MHRVVLGAALAGAILYIGWLRHELAIARSRGDMYRDIAAADLRSAQPGSLRSDPAIHEG